MAQEPIHNRSSDDQSVSDKEDEKLSVTAEREHGGHELSRLRFLTSYRKQLSHRRVSTKHDDDNAAKPKYEPTWQLKNFEREVSDHDIPRFNLFSDQPAYKKKVVSSNRDADNVAKPELNLRSRLGAAKTGGQSSDDDPSSEDESDWDLKKVIDKDLKARKEKTKNWFIDVPDIPRYSLPSGKLITRKERRSISYDESFSPIRELYRINRLNAVKTGGQPSDDHPSSEVKSDWIRKMVIDQDLKARRMKKNNWVIDHDAWKKCSEKDFQTKAESLLLDRKLPTQALLDEACVRYKRTNPSVQSICKSICCYIKEKSKSFLDVWAAYRYNKDDTSYGNKVVFVILTDSTHDVEITEFETYERNIIEIRSKKENDAIKIKENEDPPSSLEIEDLESCLKENAKSQIERHSNLTRVTASWYQSSGYGTEKFKLQRLPCIALYVHVKGYVPLDEEPFRSKIGKYPVDVREGVSILCGMPYDYHRNVKMGCAIRGASQGDTCFAGTLGPFLEFKDDRNLYAISCAHVFFHGEIWKRITESNQIPCNINVPAFQPPCTDDRTDLLGNVEMAVYRKGGNGYPGMEIALIKINPARYPDTGTFPDDPVLSDKGFGPLEFFNGRCCLPEHLSFNRLVYKYGCTTGQTMGKCRINGASVRTRVLRDKLQTIVLHDQIEIEQVNDIPFGDEGDSGAVVLTDHGNEVIAVGIFEGKDEDVYLMTPISPILKELERQKDRGCRLKRFETYNQPVVDPRFDEKGLKQILEQNFEAQGELRNEFELLRNQMQQGFKNITEKLNQQ